MPDPIVPDPQGGSTGQTQTDIPLIASGLLQKAGGDPIKVITHLLKENHKGRENARGLQAKIPADGSVILLGDDAKRWEAYKALGDDPKAIAKTLESGNAAITERDAYVREKVYRQAASLGGYDPDVFATLAQRDKLNLAIDDSKSDGKPVKIVSVIDGEGKKTPLADHVGANWGIFAKSLGGPDATVARKPGTPSRANDAGPAPKPGEAPTLNIEKALGNLSRYSI